MPPQPEIRAQTQHATTRPRRDERGNSDDSETLHTSRSISKASLRPSSPSSLIEWGPSTPAGSTGAKSGSSKGHDRDGQHDLGYDASVASKSIESSSKSRTPRTAGRKKKAQQEAKAAAAHHDSESTGGGRGGMGMSF